MVHIIIMDTSLSVADRGVVDLCFSVSPLGHCKCLISLDVVGVLNPPSLWFQTSWLVEPPSQCSGKIIWSPCPSYSSVWITTILHSRPTVPVETILIVQCNPFSQEVQLFASVKQFCHRKFSCLLLSNNSVKRKSRILDLLLYLNLNNDGFRVLALGAV